MQFVCRDKTYLYVLDLLLYFGFNTKKSPSFRREFELRTFTPNPVAEYTESGCTTNDAATLGDMLPPLHCYEIYD